MCAGKYLALVSDKAYATAMLDMAKSARASEEEIKESQAELGSWFVDYLHDNGYWADDNPAVSATTRPSPTSVTSRSILTTTLIRLYIRS